MEKIMKNVIITECLRLRALELSDAEALSGPAQLMISIYHSGWQSCLYAIPSQTRVALLQKRQRAKTFGPLFWGVALPGQLALKQGLAIGLPVKHGGRLL